jgi:hypothetical protein
LLEKQRGMLACFSVRQAACRMTGKPEIIS